MPRLNGNLEDRRSHVVWDTFRLKQDLPAGPAIVDQWRLFTRVTGDLAVSNMDSAGCFPSEQTFRADRVGIHVWCSNPELTERVKLDLAARFAVACKDALVLQGVMSWTSGEIDLVNGAPEDGGLVRLDKAIVIPPRQNFGVTLVFGEETKRALVEAYVEKTQVVIRFLMGGELNRPVA